MIGLEWQEHECNQGEIQLYKIGERDIFFDYNLSNDCIIFNRTNHYFIDIIFCDLENQIISGTFELEIENECGDVYEITEGRFDAPFRYF